MTMHLVGPYMTTTRYNRKTKPSKNKRNIQAQAEHDKWLTKMGVHPDQLAEKKKANGGKSPYSMPDYSSPSGNKIPTSDRICGNGTKKESMQYSGERELLGVAMMHKSNLVPVFSTKDAKEIARMRRG